MFICNSIATVFGAIFFLGWSFLSRWLLKFSFFFMVVPFNWQSFSVLPPFAFILSKPDMKLLNSVCVYVCVQTFISSLYSKFVWQDKPAVSPVADWVFEKWLKLSEKLQYSGLKKNLSLMRLVLNCLLEWTV